MKHTLHIQSLVIFLAALVLSSCIRDDLSKCGLNIGFSYTYNVHETEAFSQEADWVNLYVFDSSDRLVMQERHESVRGVENFQVRIPLIDAGAYTLVAFAGSADEGSTDFIIPEMSAGDPMEKLSARVPVSEDGVLDRKLNSLLIGTCDLDVDGTLRNVTVNMMKCTHTIRVLLMPLQGGAAINPEDYEISIEDKYVSLSSDAAPEGEDRIIYRPYFQEGSSSPDSNAGDNGLPMDGDGVTTEINSAVIAELSTSRLMYDSGPRLVIKNAASGRELMNINLTWYLSLTEIQEHKSEWSDQEYLDRQDEYALTFFFNNGLWYQFRIIVNGWVISMSDIEL